MGQKLVAAFAIGVALYWQRNFVIGKIGVVFDKFVHYLLVFVDKNGAG
jgi:hypothetical protein